MILLQVVIDFSEEALKLSSKMHKNGTVEEDFKELVSNPVLLDRPQYIILSIADGVNNFKWVLISWVPESCVVRDKMLYSSAREGLRKALGLEFFAYEYTANAIEDLTWRAFNEYKLNERKSGPFSEKEILIQHEKVKSITKSICLSFFFLQHLTSKESTQLRSNAMVSLPFSLPSIAVTSSDQFCKGEINFLELVLRQEKIELVNALLLESPLLNLKDLVTSIEARYAH